MDELLVDPIGLAWLAKTYQITPIVRMPVQSQIGGRRLGDPERSFGLSSSEVLEELMKGKAVS